MECHQHCRLEVSDYCRTTGIQFDIPDRIEITEQVKTAGADVIKTKGATFYAIAIAVNTIVESILKGASTIRTVGTVVNGPYGLHDVVVNVPSILGADGVERVLELELSEPEARFLPYSATQVRQVIDRGPAKMRCLKSAGLIRLKADSASFVPSDPVAGSATAARTGTVQSPSSRPSWSTTAMSTTFPSRVLIRVTPWVIRVRIGISAGGHPDDDAGIVDHDHVIGCRRPGQCRPAGLFFRMACT